MPTFFPKIPVTFAILSLPYVVPEGTRSVLIAYPGLTPWAKLFRPFGALSPVPSASRLGQRPTTTDQRLLMFLTKCFDLDVHTCGQIELHQRVHSLLRGLEDIEQTFVGTNLKLLA